MIPAILYLKGEKVSFYKMFIRPRALFYHIRKYRLFFTVLSALSLLLIALFFVNSFSRALPDAETGLISSKPIDNKPARIRLMSYNIGWCQKSDDCLDQVAALIREENADIVFLAAIYYECTHCQVSNQVSYLANNTDLHAYAFGENFSLGLPFYRVRSGNALLSRFPLNTAHLQRLPDIESHDPRQRRRALWAETEINGENILIGSLHNTYGDKEVNLLQVKALLAHSENQSTVLGGDFNAVPNSSSIQALRSSKRFIGQFDGPLTYPSNNPNKRLDYILAPRHWRSLEHRVLPESASAHLPVVSTFAFPVRHN